MNKSPFDPEHRRPGKRAVRPRDAATLILVRKSARNPQVLMGKRHESHKFMPGKFVFPGGRLDVADARLTVPTDLPTHAVERLIKGCSPQKARGLALAAVRETFEETGLLVGRRAESPPRTKSKSWADFLARGVEPALEEVDFIARAITPPYRSRRFDTRFFITDAETIQGDLHDTSDASGELLELHWVALEDAQRLDLPNITRMVLGELEQRLAKPAQAQKDHPVPFVYFRHGKPIREEL